EIFARESRFHVTAQKASWNLGILESGVRWPSPAGAQQIRTLQIKYRSSKSTLLQINTRSAVDSLTGNAP
ncbi:MAG TPA: hypothetical protein PKM58_01475, partial [Pyrinomonadaceae bacterium]|nr:hypothetical protein [Pyrinomonadaceae bacterium]